jgi:hypothetical protein
MGSPSTVDLGCYSSGPGGGLYSPNNISLRFALSHADLLKSGHFLSGSMIMP